MRNTGHTSSQDETKEKAEEKEKEKKEKKEVKPHTLKSNNSHLTGGEKKTPIESYLLGGTPFRQRVRNHLSWACFSIRFPPLRRSSQR